MEASVLAALSLGFFRGLQHALDPDHLVAVSTIVSEEKSIKRSSLVGTYWGLGHTASLLAVGLIVIAFRSSIPPSAALWMEMAVAAMLIGLGISVMWREARTRGIKLHSHAHSHEGEPEHAHIHLHTHEEHEHGHHWMRIGRRPFIIGLVHGVAGSAALTLAVLTTIPSVALGLIYIALFGIGSVGGMLLMSALISLPFAMTARRFATINSTIRVVAGLASLLFGVVLALELLEELGRIAS